jgi:hypothetical protein
MLPAEMLDRTGFSQPRDADAGQQDRRISKTKSTLGNNAQRADATLIHFFRCYG